MGSSEALSVSTPVIFWFEVVSTFPTLAAPALCQRKFGFVHDTFGFESGDMLVRSLHSRFNSEDVPTSTHGFSLFGRASNLTCGGRCGSSKARSVLTPVIFSLEVVSTFPTLAASELCRRRVFSFQAIWRSPRWEFEFVHGTSGWVRNGKRIFDLSSIRALPGGWA